MDEIGRRWGRGRDEGPAAGLAPRTWCDKDVIWMRLEGDGDGDEMRDLQLARLPGHGAIRM